MNLIIFIVVVIIIAVLSVRIIFRRSKNSPPALIRSYAAGIRPGEAERILVSGEYWQRQKTLLTEREVSFMKGLFRIVDMNRWYLCPQVRVADIVQLNGNIRPRSRQWWQLFRIVSQWHVDVVIVERCSFSIVAAVELDDASHLRPERRRRDILLEEVLRQAGIPLLRSHDARKLLQMTGE
ncbi:DUF2726 domain-containing protein [Escherichia coli]|nr:DUF2726 domain-containing protein [Escherichia coli]